ncbi:ATP-binding cassette subfamily C member 4-like [Diprion similis]|uniref:ATP-binding cassette subfamily C member 4-like n=1 Tax=Diprion similis TaxID=362088 RepID=UPI001EF75925|nr:ATP-binding cassette subfamily C member 4-like [Diprion similis]
MDTKKRQSLPSPEESSNFLKRLFFGWAYPIFLKGAKRDLQVTDLYDPLKSDESEGLGNRLEREWQKELAKAKDSPMVGEGSKRKPKKKPSLTLALIRMFWIKFMLQGLLFFVQLMAVRILQPVVQGWVIGYFDQEKNALTQNEALIYAAELILLTLASIFLLHHSGLRTQEMGMCVRISCCSMIYRKILRLDLASVSNTAAGQVANLISNDVARFDNLFMYLHYVWIMPLQVTLIGYVMWQSVGMASLVGIGAMILQTIPIQGYFSNLSAKLRSKIAVKTDERVQLMSELISGVEVIKMYSWEKPFDIIVAKVRGLEIKLISITSYLKGIFASIMVFSERVTLYLTLITFALMGNPLTAEITFPLATLFNLLQMTCAIAFPQAIIQAGEAIVSLRRIADFLLLDEVQRPESSEFVANDRDQPVEKHTTSQLLESGKETELESLLLEKEKSAAQITSGSTNGVKKPDKRLEHGISIELVNVAANWVSAQLPPTLCELSMEVKSKSLTVLVGSVGSGKSSVLHLLLGELPVGAGRLSYFTGENNDKTRINSQDIRISYTSQDPWLFPASVRANILFGQPYNRKRYQEVTRVCALVKDFEQLPQGDMSFVGERGASLSGGQRARVNLARAVYRDADLYLLDDPLSAVDAHVGRHLFEECIQGYLKGKTRILVTHQLQFLRQADSVIVLNRGSVMHQGTYEELEQSAHAILASQKSEESETVEEEKEEVSHVEKPDFRKKRLTSVSSERPSERSVSFEDLQDVEDEEVATGTMSTKVYTGYFLSGGNVCSLILLTLTIISGQLSANLSDFWVTYWTNQNTKRAAIKANETAFNITSSKNETSNNFHQMFWDPDTAWFDQYGLLHSNVAIQIYTILIAAAIFFLSLRSLLFMKICMTASRTIHDSMFSNLLRATMRFFNTNPTGRILNRFSKDVGAMDELLPRAMLEALQVFTVMLGILAMIGIVNPWTIIPMLFVAVLFYWIRVYYLKTAQDIKRLEGITKSPVFSHVSSTLDGLTTIRSSGVLVQNMLRQEFDHHQDAHTGAWYLTIGTATAFGFTLDLVSCLFTAFVCFSFILINDFPGGSVGLAISQCLILTGMVQYGVRLSAEVVSQMTSVERVLQYTNLPKEGPFTTSNPPPDTWPSQGALVMKNVSMKYADDKPPVLKDLNLKINPGWKVGIVGRTGAGKSSLISALFRLTGDGLEGEIVLDGIDTKSIGLQELRPRISIIPQEPILFSASLRYNLDPFDQYSDAKLWDSLREVELGDSMPSLDFRVAEGGANFSVGQRQLICLARAILRNNRLLVLDEATANIDRSTDDLIQNTIRRRFADCTVLTIAHRLNTIMDSDRVLVMEAGRVMEFDHPHLLLRNPNGHFSQMLQQTGKAMADKLALIAERTYQQSGEVKAISNDGVTSASE